jgi:hypothetical protein
MSFREIAKVEPGDRPSAAHLNEIVEAVNRLGRLVVGPGLEMRQTPSGTTLSLSGVARRAAVGGGGGGTTSYPGGTLKVLGAVQGTQDADTWVAGAEGDGPKDPISEPEYWGLIEAWDSGGTYAVGAEVIGSDTLIYEALLASGPGDPKDPTTPNPTYWVERVGAAAWDDFVFYEVDDIVIGSNTYPYVALLASKPFGDDGPVEVTCITDLQYDSTSLKYLCRTRTWRYDRVGNLQSVSAESELIEFAQAYLCT